jgi:geranylgeranyl reductase family protein
MKPVPSSKYYDVIIVGMGPAGASAAYELSQAGVSVLGLEKYTHPRYKVCGGGLSARIERILPSDFQSVVEETIYRVQFTYGGKDSFVIESSQPIAYMTMRDHFDQWLMDKARLAGTEVREDEPAEKVKVLPEGVEVTTAQGRYHSQYIIGADGAMSLVAQHFFPDRRMRKIPALESEIRNPSSHLYGQTQMTLISLSAAKKGYGWIFPKRNGLSVGVGEFVSGAKRPKQSFHTFSTQEPTLATLQIPTPLGHPLPIFNRKHKTNGDQWTGSLVNHRAMLVGDAGHLVDPLLGEGIYYAVRSGQLAADSILSVLGNPNQRLDEYEKAAYREFGQEFRIASRLAGIIYGIPRVFHHWVGRNFPEGYQRVLHRYCQVLQGFETYQTLWARVRQRLPGPFWR